MSAARLLFPLACLLLLTACTGAHGGSLRDADLPAGVSNHFAGLMSLDDPAAFRTAAAERGLVTTADGVVLDIQTRNLTPADRDAFNLPGLKVRSFRPEYERIDGVARTPEVIRAVAKIPGVRAVMPAAQSTIRNSNDAAY